MVVFNNILYNLAEAGRPSFIGCRPLHGRRIPNYESSVVHWARGENASEETWLGSIYWELGTQPTTKNMIR